MCLMQGLCSCGKKDAVIAKVYDRKLHFSELKDLVESANSPADSLAILNNYINQWVKEQVFYREADKELEERGSIKKSLANYEDALQGLAYENELLRSKLDTVVTDTMIKAYFAANPEQFRLKAPLMRCLFIKSRVADTKKMSIGKWIVSKDPNDRKLLVDFCKAKSMLYMLQDTVWFPVSDIKELIPTNKLSNFDWRGGSKNQLVDDNIQYDLKILEWSSAGNIAPFNYASNQIKTILENKKKIEGIDQYKKKLIKSASESNKIKVFTKDYTPSY